MKRVCRVDHRRVTSDALARLVSEGGGSTVVACEACGSRFLVTYRGPLGLFTDIRALSEEYVAG